MFENFDFEAIETEKLDYIKEMFPKLDTRKGSLIHVATAGNSYEDAMIYMALDYIINNTFAIFANRYFLKLRAADRGIYPFEATYAVGLCVLKKSDGSPLEGVVVGQRFTGGDYIWAIAEEKGSGEYLARCETAGDSPNGYMGKLIPLQAIKGLGSAILDSICIYGEEEEGTEDFRQRYLDSFGNTAYGFNRAEYVQKIDSLDGVGACKPFRATKVTECGIIEKNCGGHVTVAILSSKFTVPSQELVDYVQTVIDPTQNHGDGLGLAPIDHEVHIIPATARGVRVGLKMAFQKGIRFEDCKPYIEEVITSYFKELNTKWEKETLTARIVQIEANLLSLDDYIVDVLNIELDGKRQNITAEEIEIFELLEVAEID